MVNEKILSKKEIAEFIEREINSNHDLEKAMIYLFARWQDEKEYEDFKEYEKIMAKEIEKVGVKFVKGSKRPFGVIFQIQNLNFLFYMTSKFKSWKHIK